MKQRQRAFSLMEMMVAAAAAAGLLVAVMGIFSLALRRWNVQASHSMATQEATVALEKMCKEIRDSLSFSGQSVNTNPVYNFTLPNATDASGNYVPQRSGSALTYNAGTQVRFYLSDTTGSQSVIGGKALWRAYLPAGQVIWQKDNTWSLRAAGIPRYDNIQSLTFTIPSTNSVQVSLQVTATQGKEPGTSTLTRQVYLANHN